MRIPKKKQGLINIAVIVAGITLPAHGSISYQISNGGLEYANVSMDGTAYNGILAGGIGITQTGGSGGPSSYVSVCTDFMASLYLGNTYTFNSPISISGSGLEGLDPIWGADNSGKTVATADATSATLALDNAAEIFYKNASVLTSGTTDQKAALQLAVWTALYDTTSTGTIDLTGSRFDFDASSAAGIFATDWLSGLVNPTSSAYVAPPVSLLTPNPPTAANGSGNPDGAPPQELLVVTPVPELTTLFAALVCLLPFGFRAWRSRTNLFS